jgi:type IV secretion system protein VirB6
VDCQARALGHTGFSGIDGSALPSELLVACLTLFVALIGLRLLAGESWSIAEATRAALRAGLVIVFSTSWAAYQTVFYNVATQAPAALAGALLSPLGLRAASVEETASGFQSVYDAVNHGMFSRTSAAPPPVGLVPGSPPGPIPGPGAGPPPPPATMLASDLTPGGPAGLFLMLSSLGGLLGMRLAAGFLLALGPIVIVFSLFEPMVGVFVGWVRALLGVTLAAVSASVVAALELDFLQSVVVPRATTEASAFIDPGLLVSSAMFAVLTLGGFWAAFTVARGFHLWPRLQAAQNRFATAAALAALPAVTAAEVDRAPQPSRTRAIVDAIRRDGDRGGVTGLGGGTTIASLPVGRDAGRAPRETSWIAPQGLSQGPRRSVRLAGKTVSAARRDNRR